jgi:hypothetical protein
MKPRSGIVVMLTVAAGMLGCATAKEGTVAGGLGGAAAGAAAGATAGAPVAGVGAIVGGALGAAGGAVVGARNEYNNEKYREQALRSARMAEENPALATAVREGGSADLNDDGFITTDEIIALEQAGLSDDEMIARLRASQQVFGLTPEQEGKLLKAGVSERVVAALRGMNADLTSPRRSG